MTREEALRSANEIAQRVLAFGEHAARAADGADAARVEARHADEMMRDRDAEKRRSERHEKLGAHVRIVDAKDITGRVVAVTVHLDGTTTFGVAYWNNGTRETISFRADELEVEP